MPYIYKIINDINNKVYIGKTISTIQKRWAEHCSDYKKMRCEKRPLYNAMNKYGIDHFNIVLVEETDISSLNDREKYWIKYYDSYRNGYNGTTGGDGRSYLDYDLICSLYQELGTCKQVAAKLNIDEGHVSTILKACGIKIKHAWKTEEEKEQEKLKQQAEKKLKEEEEKIKKEREKQKRQEIAKKERIAAIVKANSKKIDMYDLNNNFIKTFSSIKEASQWCVENNLTESKVARNIRVGICKCLAGKYKYSAKHIWRYHTD